jgi:hypothetical protein
VRDSCKPSAVAMAVRQHAMNGAAEIGEQAGAFSWRSSVMIVLAGAVAMSVCMAVTH